MRRKQIRPRISDREYRMLCDMRRQSGNTLAIGDIHAPFTNSEYRDFCASVRDRENCHNIVFIGDLVDNHAVSRHPKDPNGFSAGKEAEEAQAQIDRWVEEFPDAYFCLGNHDERPGRLTRENVGCPDKFIRTFEEAWNLPDTWTVGMTHEIDGVLYEHGTGNSGMYAHINLAMANRQSTVMGHTHSHGGVIYRANREGMIFGMNCGCGIDVKSYAMAYGTNFKYKPTLGCGVVYGHGAYAAFIPMEAA